MTVPLLQHADQPQPDLVHELAGIRVDGILVEVRLEVRRPAAAGAAWTGRVRFVPEASLASYLTAEIFRGGTDADLLAAARGLREHHYRDLYRSLQGGPAA